MKKISLTLVSLFLLCGCAACKVSDNFDILTLFSSGSNAQNRLWVGTFQLAFNEMRDNIFKRDIIFANEKPSAELKGLNAQEFKKDMISDSSYYLSWGETSLDEKVKIINEIKEKFGENSDIIETLDWAKAPGRYYAYAMLKKEFEFYEKFDKLGKFAFNNSNNKYEFFGINSQSNKILRKSVRVLFYNNKNDYAIQLYTKNNDIVYLWRTNKNDDFKSLFSKMLKNTEKFSGNEEFSESDTLKIPNLKIKKTKEYPQLCKKRIEGTDLYFSQALETIEFELDNKGGKVKSEAAIMTDRCSILAPESNKIRNFDFDKTFVLFLIDKDKEDPYFALRVNSLASLGL